MRWRRTFSRETPRRTSSSLTLFSIAASLTLMSTSSQGERSRMISTKVSGGIADKTCSPEFEAVRRWGAFVSHTVHGYNIDSVGDGMASLDSFPGGVLGDAVFRLLAGMPSNSSRIEKQLCSMQDGEPGRLGIPLAPADQNPDSGVARVPGVQPEVSRSEIELFVIQRVIGNVHLSIFPHKPAVGIENGCRVVVEAGRAALEQGCDQDNLELACKSSQKLRRRSGNPFGKLEV